MLVSAYLGSLNQLSTTIMFVLVSILTGLNGRQNTPRRIRLQVFSPYMTIRDDAEAADPAGHFVN